MPAFVPSTFSFTIKDGSATNASDSFRPTCLSSSVPFEPNKCGVRGYLTKSSRVAPITVFQVSQIKLRGRAFALALLVFTILQTAPNQGCRANCESTP